MNKRLSIDGLGTRWWFEWEEGKSSKKIESTIAEIMTDFEARFSRFKDDSLVGQVNVMKKLRSDDAELFEMLDLADKFYRFSSGKFNVLSGTYLEAAGYDRSYSLEVHRNQEEISLGQVQIDDDQITIPDDNILDLGAIGKGYLIDKLATALESDLGIEKYVINGGGDIKLRSDSDEEFLLESPWDKDQSIGQISLKSGSICSSSNNRRRWKARNSDLEFTHIVDGESGLSGGSVAAAFAYGKSAATTDGVSTLLCIIDETKYQEIVEEFGVEYLVVYNDGKYIKSENYPGKLHES